MMFLFAAGIALIAVCVDQGHGEGALTCYEQKQHEGVPPDATTGT